MTAVDHLDLVVTDLERSLDFYNGLLEPLGFNRNTEIVGERGERVVYIGGADGASVSLRQAQSDAHPIPYDRYAVGLHHLCFAASSREAVDERAAWLREHGAEIESGPADIRLHARLLRGLLLRPGWDQARDHARCASIGWPRVARLSTYFLPTLREDPADAEALSHRLMVRAGLVRQLGAGLWTWLPGRVPRGQAGRGDHPRGDRRDRRPGDADAGAAAGRAVGEDRPDRDPRAV